MFFRNLLVYRITQAMEIDAAAIEQALASKRARPCGRQELETYGFVAPVGGGEDAPLLHVVGGFLYLVAKKSARNLPGAVVRDAVTEKVKDIEERQARKVYKKERDQLKDEVIQQLLPHAFVRHSTTRALIMPEQGLIVVDSASPKVAEDLLSTLRECIGSLPVRPLTVKIAPTAMVTEWVKQQRAGEGFFVLDECEMRDTTEDGGIVRCKRQDLTSDEIQLHLSAGKLVTQLALAWQDKLSFMLDDKLVIKRLKFEQILHDKADDDGGNDDAGQKDATLLIMGATFAEFIPELAEKLGGEEMPSSI
ncbi:recombination-associated protein RdgC [Pseudomonas sp.]|jgi:recombination associated protein RdgC|uniref:recombination-associated protein RdgC n=1 Tax=Pseudomonas sp. TaxID=306 RepID=UPI002EDBB633